METTLHCEEAAGILSFTRSGGPWSLNILLHGTNVPFGTSTFVYLAVQMGGIKGIVTLTLSWPLHGWNLGYNARTMLSGDYGV